MIIRRQHKAWNDKDIAFIRKNFGQMTAAAMSRKMGRTLTSVESQIYKMRVSGVINAPTRSQKINSVNDSQMGVNVDAVKTETLFLIGYGDYPMFYKRQVRDGLAKALKEKDAEWFWDRRDWILARWLHYFAGSMA